MKIQRTDKKDIHPSDKGKKDKVKKGRGAEPKAKTSGSTQKSRKLLDSQVKNYETVVPEPDVFGVVAKNLEQRDIRNVREVNRKSEVIASPFLNIPVNINNFISVIQKSELTKNAKFSITINDSPEEIQKLNEFIADPENKKYLKRIDSISINRNELNEKSENANQIQDLLNTISKQKNALLNLTKLKIDQIHNPDRSTINIPELPSNLTSLSINSSLSTLVFPETLPSKLESIFLKCDDGMINFPKKLSAPSLQSISCDAYFADINFPDTFPKNLKSISLNLHESVINSEIVLKPGLNIIE